jgi:hypothetical protein
VESFAFLTKAAMALDHGPTDVQCCCKLEISIGEQIHLVSGTHTLNSCLHGQARTVPIELKTEPGAGGSHL